MNKSENYGKPWKVILTFSSSELGGEKVAYEEAKAAKINILVDSSKPRDAKVRRRRDGTYEVRTRG